MYSNVSDKIEQRRYSHSLYKIMVVMQLTVVVLFAACLTVSANTYAQKVTIVENKASLQKVFREIKRQAGYSFVYAKEDISRASPVTIDMKNADVKDVLKVCFASQPLTFTISNDIIVVKPKPALPVGLFPPQNKISGIVTDSASRQPLVGVTIKVKGGNIGAVTDAKGMFNLTVPDDAVLELSYLGYTSREIRVGAETEFNISLAAAATGLNQLVVVGYGTQKKGDLTGAATVVDSKLLQSRPAANVSSLLEGTVPNLEVKFASGMPGAGGSFNIRGVNSISNNAKPLVIIDGFEGDIDQLNPNDIASITVLKDASVAAVYGARASYGVILVKTKNGSKNKTTISYSGQTSFSRSTTSSDYESRGYYSAAINDLFYSNYAGTPYTRYTDEDYYQLYIRRNDKTQDPDRPWVTVQNRDGKDSYVYYANTDWYHWLFNLKRPMQNHNVSVSGGSDNITYRLSGSFFSQDGIFRQNTDNFRRYNLRSKVNFKVNSWLDINTELTYFNSTYGYPGYSGVQNTFNSMNVHGLASLVPVNPDGTFVYQTTVTNYNLMDGRAALLAQGLHRNEDKRAQFTPTIEAVLHPVKGLEIRTSYRYSQFNYHTMNRSVNIPYSKYPGEILYITSDIGINRLYEAFTTHEYQALNSYATYSKMIHQDHHFKLMAGINYEAKHLKDVNVSRDGLLSDRLSDFNIATGDVMDIDGGQNEYALFGAFYRLNYSYKDKYLFEAAGREDGTSRFSDGHRYGFFPSFSAGWRISNENFFKQLSQRSIDDLKLRLSYGSLGNQQVGYYDYIQTISAGDQLSYTFGDGTRAGYSSVSAPNSTDLTWETVNSTNLGLDASLFRSRLSFSFDIYRRATLNMLTAGKKLPAYYGASVPKENAADLVTRGWELSMGWKGTGKVWNKKLTYHFNVGLGDNTSKITRFDNPNKNLADFYDGEQLGDIWGYSVDGYFKTDKEATGYDVDQTSVNTIINTSAVDPGVHAGDMKFVDLDGDRVISEGDNTLAKPGDRKIIGNSLPRYNFNIALGGSWNHMDVSVFIQGIGHQDWYPNPNAAGFWGPYSRPYATFIPSDFLSKVWSEDNPNAYFPRPRGYIALSASNRSLGVENNKYLQNLMYVRLKNVTVGYTLPGNLAKKVGLSDVRVYFSGENMFTYTTLESDYIDPEQASASNTYKTSSSDAKIYPWAMTFTFGLDISL